MPLNSEEIEIFRLTELCYCYIWKPELQWDKPNYTKPSIVKSLPYTMALFVVFIFGLSSACSALFLNWFQANPNRTFVICMASVAGLLLSISFICKTLGKNNVAEFVHKLLCIADQTGKSESLIIHSKFSKSYQVINLFSKLVGADLADHGFSNNRFVVKLLLKSLVVLLAFLPPVLVVSCLITGIDTTYFILCKLKLETSFSAKLARLGILCIVAVEGVRSANQLLLFLFVFIIRLEQIKQNLACLKDQPNAFRNLMNIVNLEWAKVNLQLNQITYFAFTTLFWAVVGFVWIVVRNSPSKISYTLYVACFGCVFFITTGLLLILPVLSRQMDDYKDAIKQNKQNAMQAYMVRKTKYALFSFKQSKTIRSPEFRCGYYGKLSREFCKQYFSDIVIRCFDVILLFDTPS